MFLTDNNYKKEKHYLKLLSINAIYLHFPTSASYFTESTTADRYSRV